MALSLARLRRSFALLSIILAGTLVLALAPAAISADDEAKSIEQFQPIHLSHDMLFDLESLAEDLDPMTMFLIFMQLEELGEFESTLDEDSFYEVRDLEALNDHLDGTFAEPGYLPDGFSSADAHYGVGDAGKLSATLNVSVARNISRLLDLPVDWLPDPAEHETVTMSVDVPASGLVGYRAGFDSLMIGQMGLPEASIPDEVDLDVLREAILDDPRMPDELADQLGAIENWDNTLPVPVPEGAEYEDLEIDGNPGFLMSIGREGAVLVWTADSTIYFVGGSVSPDELEQIAESIQ
jgi:hypothetical protein